MPKIRDLAINTIPSERPANPGPYTGGYWMSVAGPKDPPKPQCRPSPPPPPSPPKHEERVPPEAVLLMRQQLQQQIKRHVYN